MRFFFGRERPQNLTVNLSPLQSATAVGETPIPELPPDSIALQKRLALNGALVTALLAVALGLLFAALSAGVVSLSAAIPPGRRGYRDILTQPERGGDPRSAR